MRNAVLATVLIMTIAAGSVPAEPVIWSWEQELEPLDILEYVEDLPYDEWIEIEEVTCRRLFEDVIHRALEQMKLEPGHGGAFEQLLRERLLYFTPEFEYYWSWPNYPEDTESAVVRFPVWIKRNQTTVYETGDASAVSFSLGRGRDDSRRYVAVFLRDRLILTSTYGHRYLPGVLGEAKIACAVLAWQHATTPMAVYFNTQYDNPDGSLFKEGSFYSLASDAGNPLLIFEPGQSEPVEDNRPSNEPELELFGVEQLFTERSLEFYYGNPEPYDAWYPQAIRAIVNLCKMQLGLEDEGNELEMVLRRDFLEYVPWLPLDEDTFDPYSEPAIEGVGITRLSSVDDAVKYEFTIGGLFRRYVYVFFDEAWGQRVENSDWGIRQISYIQPIELEYFDQEGNRKEGIGDLTRMFKFTVDPAGDVVAEYYEEMLAPGGWLLSLGPEGYAITPDKKTPPIACFRDGDPEMHPYDESL